MKTFKEFLNESAIYNTEGQNVSVSIRDLINCGAIPAGVKKSNFINVDFIADTFYELAEDSGYSYDSSVDYDDKNDIMSVVISSVPDEESDIDDFANIIFELCAIISEQLGGSYAKIKGANGNRLMNLIKNCIR